LGVTADLPATPPDGDVHRPVKPAQPNRFQTLDEAMNCISRRRSHLRMAGSKDDAAPLHCCESPSHIARQDAQAKDRLDAVPAEGGRTAFVTWVLTMQS